MLTPFVINEILKKLTIYSLIESRFLLFEILSLTGAISSNEFIPDAGVILSIATGINARKYVISFYFVDVYLFFEFSLSGSL